MTKTLIFYCVLGALIGVSVTLGIRTIEKAIDKRIANGATKVVEKVYLERLHYVYERGFYTPEILARHLEPGKLTDSIRILSIQGGDAIGFGALYTKQHLNELPPGAHRFLIKYEHQDETKVKEVLFEVVKPTPLSFRFKRRYYDPLKLAKIFDYIKGNRWGIINVVGVQHYGEGYFLSNGNINAFKPGIKEVTVYFTYNDGHDIVLHKRHVTLRITK